MQSFPEGIGPTEGCASLSSEGSSSKAESESLSSASSTMSTVSGSLTAGLNRTQKSKKQARASLLALALMRFKSQRALSKRKYFCLLVLRTWAASLGKN